MERVTPNPVPRAGLALQENTTLEELDLESNNITGAGARHLADALVTVRGG